MRKNGFIGMPYKKTGAVIRYVQFTKTFQVEELLDGTGLSMAGASERYSIIEIARRYFEKGQKKAQTDFNKYSPCTGRNFWDDCNLYGNDNITIKPAQIYGRTWEMLEGTALQYSGAQQLQEECPEFNLMDYMDRYMQYPQMEMFSKMGLTGIAMEMTERRCGIIANKQAERPEDFLGINKGRMKLLISQKGNIGYLEAMQKERRMHAHWTDEELLLVKETGAEQSDLELALRHMSMKQLKNRLEKYAGCGIPKDGLLCSRAAAALTTAAQTYFDYLGMRQQRGYDLGNTVFLWPKNLQAAHGLMVREVNQEEMEKRDKQVKEKYPNIEKNYRKLRNRYFYEDGDFLIRPARSAEEIVDEGRSLHHCVGGDTYLSRHNGGKSIILFLRAKTAPETPYITVEIQGERINQWFGAYDKKPDKGNMDKWLKKYVAHLKEAAGESQGVAAIA